MLSNLSYIKNNMFYQGNATSSFLVDYLATVYVEPGSTAELWIETRDMLGNEKTASSATCEIMKGGLFVANATSSISSGGVYSYWNLSSNASSGSYYWNCTLTGSTINLMVPFFVSTIGQQINQTLGSQFEIRISDFGEVSVGQQYMVKIWVTDEHGTLRNADALPTVTLYDPVRNQIVQNVSMIQEATGIYYYNFTTSSSQTGGVWETVVNTVNNGIAGKYGDYWELESSPAEVTIVSISDKVIPEIKADVRITNEGNAAYEYHYQYCAVDTQDNQCGGSDDICYGVGAKLLQPSEIWNTQLACSNGFVAGSTYWFKVIVFYGTEKSGASQLFIAEAGAVTPTTAPAGGGGGGGGGGGAAPAKPYVPPEVVTPPTEMGKLLAIIARVPPPYLAVPPGSLTGVEITMPGLTTKLKGAEVWTILLDINEKLYASTYDTADFLPGKTITRKILVPDSSPLGKYILRTKVVYVNDTVTYDNYIDVIEKEKPSEIVVYVKKYYKVVLIAVISFLILLLLLIFLIICSRRRREYRETRPFKVKLVTGESGKDVKESIEKALGDMERMDALYKDRAIDKGTYDVGKQRLINKVTNYLRSGNRPKPGGDLNRIIGHMRREIK